MLENTSLIALLILLICFYFLLIKLDTTPRSKVTKRAITSHKKQLKKNLGNNEEPEEEEGYGEISQSSQSSKPKGDNPANPLNRTQVSSEIIDELAEYNVFRELGYVQQATRALERLVGSNSNYHTPEYIFTLGELYIEVKKVNSLSELLEEYAEILPEENLRLLLQRGFELEPDNLRLQLICSKVLKEDPVNLGAKVK